MVKNIFPAVAIIFLLASCSSLKPLSFTSNKQVMNVSAEPESKPVATNTTKQVKFIDNITVSSQATTVAPAQPKITAPAGGDKFEQKETVKTRGLNIEETAPPPVSMFGDRSAVVEMASPVQLKYAVLLNTEVEQLQDKTLLESVDEWYGTRYRMGGTTKSGIDCSAFVQASLLAAYGLTLPRTAREQYKASERISRTELKEGDLVFFNTRGGVSHVGIYLQNNKFIHASVSNGVVVSDMFDAYYLKRYVGAGRMENKSGSYSSSR
jgi:cell wall-associated NlpC family hydrolase